MINSMKCISDYNGKEEKDTEKLWDAERQAESGKA